jgi:hypothetical protein
MDESQWEEVAEVVEASASPSVVFSLRFTPRELSDLRREADAWGTTVSAMIKKAALDWGKSRRVDIAPTTSVYSFAACSSTSAPMGVVTVLADQPEAETTMQPTVH